MTTEPPPTELAALLEQAGVEPESALADATRLAWAHAPFLRGLMRSRGALLARLRADGGDAVVEGALATLDDDEIPVATRLRRARGDVALAVALADLSGEWPLERVTAALSRFADRAIDLAIATAIGERAPGAEPVGFTALALGKLGSGELNYSSDVDLILLHDRDRMPRRARDDPDEAAARVARRVVELLQNRDGDGYAFRVDLRLRPSPEATPITVPIAAAEQYYQSEALPWERAAFIRARACAGDVAMGRGFLAAIEPFVWRRSLDYVAIRDVRAISLRIRDHFATGQAVGPGFDLKRGRGGIREVEFFAQIQQLIFGGRDPTLRAPATLDALAALAAARHVPRNDAAMLGDAYRLLRTVEHRLQMRADEQTHSIPVEPAALDGVACFAGFADWPSLARDLERVTGGVGRLYDTLVDEPAADGLPRGEELVERIVAAGFEEPEKVAALVEGWRSGRVRALRSAEAQRAFEALLPGLLAALGATPEGQAGLTRFDRFLEQLPVGLQLFAMLERNPRLVGLLARLLGMTPLLADALARQPSLFDALLDPDAFAPLPDAQALEVELRSLVARDTDVEAVLDRVRRWTAERRFQLGAQLVEGVAEPLAAAASYAALADAAMRVLADTVGAAFEGAHGRVAGGRLVVLGFGRYGGSALTARSDLDLVFLFSGTHDATSDGPRPLPATTYFNRLAQRLTVALSVPTAAGALYEVDTRLRPSGAQGLLAVTIDSFAAYQAEAAWTWEHMALTRARAVVATPEDRAAVEAAVAAVLGAPRDGERLRADVVAMRADMQRGKREGGPWDVKLAEGGLVDLEFVVHYLQLRDRTAFTPDLHDACAALVEGGALPAAIVAAHDLMTRLLVLMRLVAPDASDVAALPGAVRDLLASATGFERFDALDDGLRLAKATVVAAWVAAFGHRREIAR